MTIEWLRAVITNAVYSDHALRRMDERVVTEADIMGAVLTGSIIEEKLHHKPDPKCLVCGRTLDGRYLHIPLTDEISSATIITVYWPDDNKWKENYTVRKSMKKY